MRYLLDVDKRLKITDELIQKFWDLPVYVPFHGEINEESGKKFIDSIQAAETAALTSGQKIIPVTINSGGGSVYACCGMIDAMKNCSIPIATVAESRVMSAAAWLFTCGTEGHRYIAPNATVMIHTVHLGKQGKIDEIKASTQEGDRLNDKMFKMMADNCGHHEDYFRDLLKNDYNNSEWYMDAQTALKHNIANKIGIPNLKVNVKLEHSFGLDDKKSNMI